MMIKLYGTYDPARCTSCGKFVSPKNPAAPVSDTPSYVVQSRNLTITEYFDTYADAFQFFDACRYNDTLTIYKI